MSDRPQPWDGDAVSQQARRLRAERRSFVVGSVLVLFVTRVALAILASMILGPELHRAPEPHTFSESLARMRQSFALLALHPPLALVAVELAAMVALFVLNYRYSSVIQRPRWAYGPTGGTGGRLMWACLLMMNSLIYDSVFLVPELVLILLLARWGKEAISASERLQSA